MTEAEWLVGGDVGAMLDQVAGRVSARKLRLFACACCRRYWSQLSLPQARRLVDLSEQVAEGLASPDDPQTVREGVEQALADESFFHLPLYEAALHAGAARIEDSIRGVLHGLDQLAVREALYGCIPGENEAATRQAALEQEGLGQAAVLREVVANPFRPVAIDPTWLRWDDGCVLNMAQGIYEGSRFDELPILADALEEAGCISRPLLEHLRAGQAGHPAARAPGHVRGCWALDLLLSRS